MVCTASKYACKIQDNASYTIESVIEDCKTEAPITISEWNCSDSTPSSQLATTSATLQISTQSAEAIHDTVYIIWIGFVVVILALGVITAIKVIGGKHL